MHEPAPASFRSSRRGRLLASVFSLYLALAISVDAQADAAFAEVTIDTAAGQSHTFQLEVASTEEARRRGLMQRTDLPERGGMLFRFEKPRIASMWMKDTLIPLDMLFVRADWTIAGIAAWTTPLSLEIISAPEPVIAVVELKGGTCDRLGIRVGDRVRHPDFAADAAATSGSSGPRRIPSYSTAPRWADGRRR